MTAPALHLHRPRPPRPWPRWTLEVVLWVLFIGPIISPLFRATGLPLVADTGELARDLMSRYICPTPDRSIMLLGLPMAVCARCWGATFGLWAARLLAGAPDARAGVPLRWFRRWHWAARLALCALPFLLWPVEIIGQAQGLWHAPIWLLLINGAQAGFAAGLFFCSIWPDLWPAK